MISYDVAVTAIGGFVLIALRCIRSTSYIPRAWLKERIHVALIKGERDTTFGKLKLGDEIWVYSNPAERWQHLAGRSGLVLVRNGNIIRGRLVFMN